MSQVYIAVNPAAVNDFDAVLEKTEAAIRFLHDLPSEGGAGGVHAPGENLEKTRRQNREEGIPVTEITWQRILEAAERGRRTRKEAEA